MGRGSWAAVEGAAGQGSSECVRMMTRRGKSASPGKARHGAGLASAWVRRAPQHPSSRHKALFGIGGPGGVVLPCALGRSGISARKREGDGATPRAALAVLRGYARFDRNWQRGPFWTRIDPRLGWCDAPLSPCYNRPVRLPFVTSHETMTREDALYDRVIVLDWNLSCRARGRGSAIFLHQARLTGGAAGPTEGCIALAPDVFARWAPRLMRLRRIVVL